MDDGIVDQMFVEARKVIHKLNRGEAQLCGIIQDADHYAIVITRGTHEEIRDGLLRTASLFQDQITKKVTDEPLEN